MNDDIMTLLSAKEVKDTEIREEYDSALKILEAAINDSVDRRVKEKIKELNDYKDAYESAITELEEDIEKYKREVTDCTENNLTINRIGSEGGLRALLTVYNAIKDYEQYSFKNKETE